MSDGQTLPEISSMLADIVDHLERKPSEQLRDALAELSSGLADVVQALEGNDEMKGHVEKLVAAIGQIRIEPQVSVAAPKVDVHVSPTPVTVAAPSVSVTLPEPRDWIFDIEYGAGGVIRRIHAVKQ